MFSREVCSLASGNSSAMRRTSSQVATRLHVRVLLLPAQRRRRGTGGGPRPLPLPAPRRRRGTIMTRVLGHVDLDPLLLYRLEDLGQVPLADRVIQIVRQRLVVRELDDQGVGESMVVTSSVASERHALDAVDSLDERLRLVEGRVDLIVGRPWLPLQQHDVLDHGGGSSRSGGASGLFLPAIGNAIPAGCVSGRNAGRAVTPVRPGLSTRARE